MVLRSVPELAHHKHPRFDDWLAHGSGGELKVEEKLMTDKSNFTPDEWKLILESVMMAGIAVSAAEE